MAVLSQSVGSEIGDIGPRRDDFEAEVYIIDDAIVPPDAPTSMVEQQQIERFTYKHVGVDTVAENKTSDDRGPRMKCVSTDGGNVEKKDKQSELVIGQDTKVG
jgi:hypothetical protein